MMRAIHRRADQIVHGGVQDQEIAALAIFDVNNPRDQHTGIARNQPPRFNLDLAAQMADRALDQRAVIQRQGRRVIGPAVGNAKPAAQIQPADVMAFGAQPLRQLGDLEIGLLERLQLGQLAADMHIDANDIDPGQAGGFGIDFRGAADRDAELVFFPPRGDFFMRARINIRVHPQRNRRGHPKTDTDLGQGAQFRLGFDVELPDTLCQGQSHFLACLSHPGKHDAAAGHARRPGTAVFPARHHIHARAQIAQRLEDCDIRQRFDRETHQMRQRRQRLGEQAVMPRQGRGGIAVERRANRGRNIGQRHVFGMKPAVAVKEVVHAGSCKRRVWRV